MDTYLNVLMIGEKKMKQLLFDIFFITFLISGLLVLIVGTIGVLRIEIKELLEIDIDEKLRRLKNGILGRPKQRIKKIS